MVKTPTYHVFNMYKYHQDAELVDSFIETELVGVSEENMVPNLTESVSQDKDGVLNITLTNLSADKAYDLSGVLVETKAELVEAKLLSGKINDHNTFDEPLKVKAEEFSDIKISDGNLEFTIPSSSVMLIRLKTK